jgi:hypothetical protein
MPAARRETVSDHKSKSRHAEAILHRRTAARSGRRKTSLSDDWLRQKLIRSKESITLGIRLASFASWWFG